MGRLLVLGGGPGIGGPVKQRVHTVCTVWKKKTHNGWFSRLTWQAIVFMDMQSIVIKHSRRETKGKYYLDI